MMRVAEIMCAMEGSVRKPKIEETLSLLGVSISEIDETIADRPNPESEEAVESKFAELNRQAFVLSTHRANIKNITQKYDAELRRLRSYMYEFERAAVFHTAVIPFVRLIETANQYFDYKLLAQQKISFNKKGFPKSDEVHRTLLQHDGGFRSQFNCINETHVKDVAYAIFRELICEHLQRPLPTLPPDYVMDRDPEVELKKMLENETSVYDRYFIIERLPAEYNNISKEEAYKKYSEVVQSITSRGNEERQKSTSTTTAWDSETTSTAISAWNAYARHKEAFHKKQVSTSTSSNAIDAESKLAPVMVTSISPKRKREQASEGWGTYAT